MNDIMISQAVQMACLLEVSAAKPGNVNRRHDFDEITFEDFLLSGVAIGPILGRAGDACVGETVLRAVQATRRHVKINTNLGIILALTPLAKAASLEGEMPFRERLHQVLSDLTVHDAQLAYQAINLAAPKGIGTVDQGDVRDGHTSFTLLEAMALAQERDALAREYVTDFDITFSLGLPSFGSALKEGMRIPEAVLHTFLTLLAEIPDTHIARKCGWDDANKISRMAGDVLKSGGVKLNPGGIAELDQYLRMPDPNLNGSDHRFNPGTTADLVCAAIFSHLLENGGVLSI